MNKKVVIIGAGGQGRVISEIVRANNDTVVGFLDDAAQGESIIGKISDAPNFQDCLFFVALGDAALREKLMSLPLEFYTAVHPAAYVSPDAKIGCGSAVMAGAVINCGAKIGRGAIINTCASVDHDSSVGDFTHICPGAHIAGTVNIGKTCKIGTGSAVINNINICDGVMVGAGAAVVRDITESGTYVGVPAKKIK